ncbi:MAG TPA: hypothetical protein VNN79_22090 [Actinomycetota bacterium]|nr:hypothetical protein [Actinomycetota bacterium]
MNRPCAMAGRQCPNPAETLVRIAGVGDRALCPSCIATLDALGMHFRRLDETQPLPEWRTRSLARDFTGALGR